MESFSPRNGEVILKTMKVSIRLSHDGFSPRNGEVILKTLVNVEKFENGSFQSPQWGSNSKDSIFNFDWIIFTFQSPQWGSNSKVY